MRDLKSFAHTTRRTRGTYVAIVVMASWFASTNAAAEPSPADKQKARAAYTRAMDANERGDYALAARELALADELAPNSVTLQAALDAALDADAAATGMELAVRAEIRGEKGGIADLAAKARKRFAGRTGRVMVVCPGPSTCQATLDGEEIPAAKERFVSVGKHVVTVSSGGAATRREVDVQPMELTTISGSDEKPAVAASSGLSPAFFAIAAAATVGTGIGVGISGAATKEKHDSFVAAHCGEQGAPSMCTSLASGGESAQTRTNVLVGVSAALALTTVVLGVLTFSKKNPSTGPSSQLILEPRKDGAFARLVVVLP